MSPRPFSAWGAQSSPFARPGCCQRGTVATPRLCATPSTGHAPQPGGLYQILVKYNKPPGWWSSRKVWNPLGFCKSGRGADGRVPVFTIFTLQVVTSACCSTSTDSLPRADGPCQWQGFPVFALGGQFPGVGTMTRGPAAGTARAAAPFPPPLPGRAQGVKGGLRPLVLTLDTLGAVWPLAQAGRAPTPQERGAARRKRAAQPPSRPPARRRRGGPPRPAGPPDRAPGRGHRRDESRGAAARRQKRSAPTRGRQATRAGGQDPPRRAPRPRRAKSRRGPGPPTPQRGPPGEPGGRADGRRRAADRPQRPPDGPLGPGGGPRPPQRPPPEARGRPAGREQARGRGGPPGQGPAAGRRGGGGPRPSTPFDVSPPAPAGRRNSPGGRPPQRGEGPAREASRPGTLQAIATILAPVWAPICCACGTLGMAPS